MSTWHEIVEAARDLMDRASETGRRALLGLTGAPGAGKSTIAERLAAELGEGCMLAPMDGFHLANRVLLDLGARDRKGAEDTFDAAGYAALIERLRADTDEVVYAPEFRRDLEEPIGSALGIPRGVPLVITEGNYLLVQTPAWQRARACLDAVWYIEPPQELRHSRLIARHVAFGKSAESAREWSLGSDERNAEFIASFKPHADALITLG
ncbi:nucleoside/nucleotide kinase family protein [Micrococcales bacterium 31B]|nr:nucleoside/nucleotide kinase family protein [Micrococcales bacterium 31B]